MPGSNMNARLDAGPNQTWCDAGSVLGPGFRGYFNISSSEHVGLPFRGDAPAIISP